MKARFWAVGLVLVVVLTMVVPQTMAQDVSTDTIEFTGEITAIENDGFSQLLTVSGFTVDTSGAEINVVLALSTLVKVEGVLLDDGTVEAREIGMPEVASDSSLGTTSPDDDLELVGTLDSLTAELAIVSGINFNLVGAEVQMGLVAGDTVKVHASFDAATQTWIARELELFTDDDSSDDDAGGDSSDDMNDDVNDDSSMDDSAVCNFEIEVSSANLRSGPGTGYDVIGFAYDDDDFAVLEIHTSGAWIKVAAAGGEAWVAVSTGELDGNCSALSVSNMQFADSDDDHSDDDDFDDDSSISDDDSDDDSDHDSMDDSHDDNDDDSDDDHGDDHDDDHGDDDHSDDSSDD